MGSGRIVRGCGDFDRVFRISGFGLLDLELDMGATPSFILSVLTSSFSILFCFRRKSISDKLSLTLFAFFFWLAMRLSIGEVQSGGFPLSPLISLLSFLLITLFGLSYVALFYLTS